ncbi:MAG TPA: ATP-dependent DNA ligase [Pirellulales bacterium]|nr:ATP-dependent DNA ligase [Pirellulales bacterium]
MKAFAALYRDLDETTKTSRKLACMREYFASAPAADAAWALYFLSGRKPKRLLLARDLQRWCAEEAALPDWLFDECHDAVGDLAETIALLLPEPERSSDAPLAEWVEVRLLALRDIPPAEQRVQLVAAWREMDRRQRLVWNKLLTGSFRIGVSQTLVVRALAEVSGLPAAVIAHRLMGVWESTPEFFQRLLTPQTDDADVSRPYPFCLAHPLVTDPKTLGDVSQWLVEWKWDGIRAQCVRRGRQMALWSRGEELVTERFPELHLTAEALPDGVVLDGEIVAWKDGAVMPYGVLQRRIGRKTVGKKLLQEAPVRLIAFDLLEFEGRDIRARPLIERRRLLEALLAAAASDAQIGLSPLEHGVTWDELATARQQSRQRNVEGLMLKRLDSPYGVGRITGQWWKWKIDPHTVDAVLIYAQRGHGRRASLYTDYTFGVWSGSELVPFAKAYSGLTDEEIHQVDRFVRQNTIDKMGPVRRVKPELVFELAFEDIQLSKRHRSGVAVRFPRMARWRTDKTPEQADTLDAIKALLRCQGE